MVLHSQMTNDEAIAASDLRERVEQLILSFCQQRYSESGEYAITTDHQIVLIPLLVEFATAIRAEAQAEAAPQGLGDAGRRMETLPPLRIQMTPTPELMARAMQAVLAIIGTDDRVGPSARQAVVSQATQQMAADIARAVIEAIS